MFRYVCQLLLGQGFLAGCRLHHIDKTNDSAATGVGWVQPKNLAQGIGNPTPAHG